MRRHTGQRALYEAWSRSSGKPKRVGLLELLRPQLERLRKPRAPKPFRQTQAPSPAAEPPAPVTLKPPRPVERPEASRPGPTQPWLKTKAVQINAGRIEISIPYQIAIAIGLLVILFLLVAFRLGQMDQKSRYAMVGSAVRSAPTGTTAPAPTSTPSSQQDASPTGAAAVSAGDNLIVIARAQNKADLAPVAEHFASHGIQTGYIPYERLREHYASHGLNTGAVPQGDGFLLTTMQTYDNPERQGTDGYAAKQRITEIGALYKGKAPPGLETFAPNYFSDAYGLKIK